MAIPVAPAADGPWWTEMLSGHATGAMRASISANAPADAVEEATPTQVENAVKEVNATLQSRAVGLRFEVDKDTDKLVVKVVDRASGEVIRQIPSEEVVRIAKVFGQTSGLLVSHGA